MDYEADNGGGREEAKRGQRHSLPLRDSYCEVRSGGLDM